MTVETDKEALIQYAAKVNKAIENLERLKISAEEETKRDAVRLAEHFKDKDENSKEDKDIYYLQYQTSKAIADTFDKAINQIRTIVQYG